MWFSIKFHLELVPVQLAKCINSAASVAVTRTGSGTMLMFQLVTVTLEKPYLSKGGLTVCMGRTHPPVLWLRSVTWKK